MTKEIVNTLCASTESLFKNTINNFNLSSFEIKKASAFTSIKINATNQYLREEFADVLWLVNHENLAIKLGWTIDRQMHPGGHDERFFDWEIKKMLPEPISFVFTHSGKTFDRHRQNVSPYVAVENENRLMLSSTENVIEKLRALSISWAEPWLGGTKKHLANIVRLFESLFGHLPNMTFEEKIQHVLDVTVKGISV